MAFGSLLRVALSLLIGGVLALGLGQPANAQVHLHPDENGTEIVRSLESLRDLDYQSWQAVAYRSGPPGGPVTLRMVGYPGRVRLDHPTSLIVHSGRGDLGTRGHHDRQPEAGQRWP